MRAITLLAILILIFQGTANGQACIQLENHGEQITIEETQGDTVTIRGQEFGIAAGPAAMYRWVIFRDGKLHGVYLGLDNNPFLRVVLGPGAYRVIRYTDYYSPDGLPGITASRVIEFCILTPLEYSE